MDRGALHGKQLLAAVVFVGAILVLAVQLINPSPVMVSIGENSAEANQVGEYFTYGDVATIVVSSALGSASGTYLLLGDFAPSAPPSTTTAPAAPTNEPNGGALSSTESTGREREQQDEPNVPLKDNEETIYSLLTDADGELPQREIVEETALSKATVSRTLDALEHKDLVERKRRGMGNVVRLQ
ncbi:helix-turn-helix transcriptional regulator [Natronoarchaeum rubrum]|uniref:helix-turn-helix transcriptional regulator n=1 Tax=Natronoarchaeum rubrum TaxID=755311 RepID=UPI002112BDE8|nr:MarR family transcriptional regulator [Natronoarchaeum rubrum]